MSLPARYLVAWGREDALSTTLDVAAQMTMPRKGILRNMYVRLTTQPGGILNTTFTVNVNGAPTALVVTIAGAATFGNDTLHQIPVVAGDIVTVIVAGTSGHVGFAGCEMEFA